MRRSGQLVRWGLPACGPVGPPPAVQRRGRPGGRGGLTVSATRQRDFAIEAFGGVSEGRTNL